MFILSRINRSDKRSASDVFFPSELEFINSGFVECSRRMTVFQTLSDLFILERINIDYRPHKYRIFT